MTERLSIQAKRVLDAGGALRVTSTGSSQAHRTIGREGNAKKVARQLMAMTPGGPAPRDRPEDVDLPPGQHWVSEFPPPPAGPPPAVTKADWAFTVATEDGRTRRWDWA